MKTKNTNQQQLKNTNHNKNTNQMKNIKNKNCCSSVPFYITIVSITTIFALLLIFVLEKHENLKCVNSGLIQKVQDGKVIWTK